MIMAAFAITLLVNSPMTTLCPLMLYFLSITSGISKFPNVLDLTFQSELSPWFFLLVSHSSSLVSHQFSNHICSSFQVIQLSKVIIIINLVNTCMGDHPDWYQCKVSVAHDHVMPCCVPLLLVIWAYTRFLEWSPTNKGWGV